MLIVADQNIPLVKDAFSGLGELHLVEGRMLASSDLKDADALLVRSVTPVNESLLKESSVRFVGSATSGIDHIDTEYLQRRNIHFAYTPGNNAQTVAEYVISVLVYLSVLHKQPLKDKVLAVIGYGRIGKRVVNLAGKIGLRCLINDPPLQNQSSNGDIQFCSLDEVLPQADFVTLHTPLTRGGDYPSYHLLDKKRLAAIRDSAYLINTARGGVVDGQALLAELKTGRITAALDVWESEPNIDVGLLRHVALGTPHVAGYSLEGKLNATTALHKALCEAFELQSDWKAPLPVIELGTEFTDADPVAVLHEVFCKIGKLQEDDQALRQILGLPAADRGRYFDQQRISYSFRREFSAYRCKSPADPEIQVVLRALGFSLI